MLESFYACLFDPDQHVCFGETHKSVRVSKVQAQTTKPFFTINALDPKRDLNPTEPYHAPDKPRRADHNVVCLRNILLELDVGTTMDQMNAILRSGIPWSTCVSSGGKSLHFIISLTESLSDAVEYRKLVTRIFEALLHQNVKVDIANKNPSRFSRAPGVVRPETNRLQEMIATYSRVKNHELTAWLADASPMPVPRAQGRLLSFPESPRVYASTQQFLRSGAPTGEWNISLFRAACNLFDVGYSFDEAEGQLRAVTGVLDNADLATIKSAHRRVRAS